MPSNRQETQSAPGAVDRIEHDAELRAAHASGVRAGLEKAAGIAKGVRGMYEGLEDAADAEGNHEASTRLEFRSKGASKVFAVIHAALEKLARGEGESRG